MKKLFFAGLAVLFAGLMLASCGSEEPKPEPKPKVEKTIEVLLNGKAVKDGSVVNSKGLHLPETEDDKFFAKEGNFDYDFLDNVTLKASDAKQLGKYTIEVAKVGGEEVTGSLFQVCLIGKTCMVVQNNKFDKDNEFEVKEVNKEAGYKLYYRIGQKLPTKAIEASMSVKVKRAGKVIHQFTIKMTYNP